MSTLNNIEHQATDISNTDVPTTMIPSHPILHESQTSAQILNVNQENSLSISKKRDDDIDDNKYKYYQYNDSEYKSEHKSKNPFFSFISILPFLIILYFFLARFINQKYDLSYNKINNTSATVTIILLILFTIYTILVSFKENSQGNIPVISSSFLSILSTIFITSTLINYLDNKK